MIYIKFLQTKPLMQNDKKTFSDIFEAKVELYKKGYINHHLLLLSAEDNWMFTDDRIGNGITNCETLADVIVNRLFKEVEIFSLDNNKDFGVLIVYPRYLYAPMNLHVNTIDRFLNRVELSISKRIENNKIYIEK